jgi:hypothetical protein
VGQALSHPPRPAGPPPAEAYADQIADELVSRGIARRHGDGTLVFGPTEELIEAQVSDAVQRATALAATAPAAPPAPVSEPVILEQWSLDDLEDQAIARQLDRDEVDFERDRYLAELVAAENDQRFAAGEPALRPDVDAERFDELRYEADREFALRYADLDQDERTGGTTFGSAGAQGATTPAAPPGLIDYIDVFELASEDRPGRPARYAGSEDREASEPSSVPYGGAFEDTSDEARRNEAESGAPEVSADDMDLPDVVRRSWELTRIELRHELLIDRERRGWLTDFR